MTQDLELRQAPAFFDRLAQRLQERMTAAENQALDEVTEKARLLSSGPYSLQDLRRMGHPYAQRDPRPPLPAGIINVQSGEFISSWRRDGPRREGDDLVSVVYNVDDPVATWLEEGTIKMIARPLPAAAEVEAADQVQQVRDRAFAQVFGGG